MHNDLIILDEAGGCWSMVGMDAVDNDVTVVLDLSQYPPDLQRSQVIHMFGHALGLEHEHQRPASDFWDVVSQHIDLEKMKKDVCPAGDQDKSWFDRCWIVNSGASDTTDSSICDSGSIMHFK